MIREEKKEELKKMMQEVGIEEKDLLEKFITGSGKGGQKINKTASCVYLKHLPTGKEVKCQQARSREDNRFFARRLLVDKFLSEKEGALSPRQIKESKIRKQKKRRQRRSPSLNKENSN